jgi:rare lipoprotein A
VTRRSLHRCLPGALVALSLGVPAAAAADGPGTGGTAAPDPVPAPAPAPARIVSVHGRVAVVARADTLLGHVARFRGSARRRDAGRRVVIQRFDAATERWRAAARSIVGRRGRFIARWHTDETGQFRLRAVLRSRTATQSRHTASKPLATIASSELDVTVYRPAFATWYGPGFFGKQTACGQELTEDLVGVAHRSLPCGTKVQILYGGHTLVVPVVDRGPYSGRADWDLTQATARALGMDASDTVGAVALR